MIILDKRHLQGLTRCYSNLHPSFTAIDDGLMIKLILTLLELYIPHAPQDNLPLFVITKHLKDVLAQSGSMVDRTVIEDFVADLDDILFKMLYAKGEVHDRRSYKGEVTDCLYVLT